MLNEYQQRMEVGRPYTVFDAVAARDLEGIITEYIKNARNTIVSYLSLRKRWRCELKQGE
jgi:hypothetical protein